MIFIYGRFYNNYRIFEKNYNIVSTVASHSCCDWSAIMEYAIDVFQRLLACKLCRNWIKFLVHLVHQQNNWHALVIYRAVTFFSGGFTCCLTWGYRWSWDFPWKWFTEAWGSPRFTWPGFLPVSNVVCNVNYVMVYLRFMHLR